MNAGSINWLILFMYLLVFVSHKRLGADTCSVSIVVSGRVVDCGTGLPLPGPVKVSIGPDWLN